MERRIESNIKVEKCQKTTKAVKKYGEIKDSEKKQRQTLSLISIKLSACQMLWILCDIYSVANTQLCAFSVS